MDRRAFLRSAPALAVLPAIALPIAHEGGLRVEFLHFDMVQAGWESDWRDQALTVIDQIKGNRKIYGLNQQVFFPVYGRDGSPTARVQAIVVPNHDTYFQETGDASNFQLVQAKFDKRLRQWRFMEV